MSTPEPTLEQRRAITDSYYSFKHNAALGMLIVAPLLIALPPRKLDLYTFSLATGAVLGGNHLIAERYGKGTFSVLGDTLGLSEKSMSTSKMEHVKEQLRRDREREQHTRSQQQRLLEIPTASEADRRARQTQGLRPAALEAKAKELWLGGETEGWKERRLKEEQEKIDNGEGYGGMIMDQIWEVWNWGEKKGEKLIEQDQKVLAEQRRKQEFPEIGK